MRHAFEGDYLPYDILMREKAAFSDAVGHSMGGLLEGIRRSQNVPIRNLQEKCKKYDFAAPFTKESLLYREIFEENYPGQLLKW